VTYNNVTAGQLYEYTVSSNKVKLTNATVATGANGTAAYVTYETGATVTSNTKALGSRYFTDSTVFISVTGSKGSIKVNTSTGKQLVSTAADFAVISTAKKTYGTSTDAAVVFVNASYVSSSATDLILISDAASNQGYETLNGTDYSTYAAYLNGESITIAVDGDGDSPVKGDLYNYSINSDGAYVLTTRTTNTARNQVASALYGKYVTIAGTQYDVSGAEIVDLTDNGITDSGSLKDLIEIGGATVKVSAVFNSDDEITYLYIISATAPVSNSGTTWTITGVASTDIKSVSYKDGTMPYATTVTASGSDSTFTAPAGATSIKITTADDWTLTAA
jgi:hypothetical protein